jgi:hypothetical protein
MFHLTDVVLGKGIDCFQVRRSMISRKMIDCSISNPTDLRQMTIIKGAGGAAFSEMKQKRERRRGRDKMRKEVPGQGQGEGLSDGCGCQWAAYWAPGTTTKR